MATKKKMLQAAAGQASGGAGGAALDITDVFSTYLYEGKGGAQVIQNGIKLGDLKEADDGVYYLSSPSSVIGNNSAGNTVTATLDGNVTRDGVTTKFASSSYNFDGASNIRLSRALIDTSSSFCFETWVYFDSTGVSNDMAMLLAQYKSGENGRLLFGAQSGNLVVRYNGSTVALTAPVSASQWHHVAWSYDGTTHRLFVDGTLEDSTTTDFPIYTGVTTQLGGTDSTLLSDYDLDGRMEDIRITTGDARYTSSFTPPTASLPVTTAATVLEAGEGGLVWFKAREIGTYPHAIFDTERGATKYLRTNQTNAEGVSSGITAFNIDGFNIAGSFTTGNASPYVSWTFRKAPKFFDVVTYTGNGVAGRTVSHNLGSAPGMMLIKLTSGTDSWAVYHRGLHSSAPEDYRLVLNGTNPLISDVFGSRWNRTAPTSSVFSLGDNGSVNANGQTYVAYLFAHNDGDGEFGPNGDQDIIKCGSYVGNGLVDGPEIDLGFEPQWLLWKRTDSSANWGLIDNMRGFVSSASGYDDAVLLPNDSAAEGLDRKFSPLSTGFQPNYNGSDINASGGNYIYMAIRRGPLAQPESGTEVFDVTAYNGANGGTSIATGFPVDATLVKCRSTAGTSTEVWDRLRGQKPYLFTDSTAADGTAFGADQWLIDDMDGFTWAASDTYSNSSGRTFVSWNWKRAPGFFDVVAYSGDGVAGRTVSHNLGVAPEMMWVKSRSLTGGQWVVYHSGLNVDGDGKPETDYIRLNDGAAAADYASMWNDTAPTDSVFSLGNFSWVNSPGNTYISYLFSTLAGVSKVGSYTGNQTNEHQIDCGFTSGARFVLARKTSDTGDWYLFDSVRGITTAYDPYLYLNQTDAEAAIDNIIRPYSSGFALGDGGQLNENGATYIFYAIA